MRMHHSGDRIDLSVTSSITCLWILDILVCIVHVRCVEKGMVLIVINKVETLAQ